MALGFGYAFTTTAFLPKGALIAAIILSGLFIVFEVLVYASMIAVMPRAGGDYVWQTRVFGGGVGFVLAATGWWFILWHWVPIYAQILSIEVLQPLLTILGFTGTSAFHADWWPYSTTNGTGIFVASLLTAGIATGVVAMGMWTYARVQKWCFYGGMLGLVIMLGIFLTHSKSDFITAYNMSAHNLYGVKGDAYDGLVSASDKAGTSTYPGFSAFPFKETFLLLPFMVFYNLWPNWGATLYGEVRGASDFRKNIYAMGGALVFTTVVVVVTFAAMAHAIGFETYGIMSSAYWAYFTAPLAVFPYPGTLAAFFYQSELVQVVLILLLSLWFFGWAGSVFLSSTRMIFAAAFDRVLPEWAAKVDDRTHAPLGALALMLIPAIPISALYAYSTKFYSYTLDATLVIAITYFGTTLAAIALPWRKPEDLPGLAHREVRGRRDPARHAGGPGLRRLPGVLHLQVVLRRRLLRQQLRLEAVHAGALRARARSCTPCRASCGAGRASTWRGSTPRSRSNSGIRAGPARSAGPARAVDNIRRVREDRPV